MSAKERLSIFDNAKFLLILLVVIGHFADTFCADYPSMRALFLFIYSFHMPAFIFLSGLFARKLTEDSVIDSKRIISFISLGFLLKFLFVAEDIVLGNEVSFALLSDGGIPWFMFALAAYTALAWLLRSVPWSYVMGFSITLGLVVGYDPSIGNFLYLSRIIVFFPFYWVGYRFSPNDMMYAISHRWMKACAIVILLAAAYICIRYIDAIYDYRYLFTGKNSYSTISPDFGWANRAIAYIVSCIMGLAVLCLVPARKLGCITVFGTRTIQVYVWHYILLDLLLFFNIDLLFEQVLGPYYYLWFVALSIPVTFVLSLKLFGRPLVPFLTLGCQKAKK